MTVLLRVEFHGWELTNAVSYAYLLSFPETMTWSVGPEFPALVGHKASAIEEDIFLFGGASAGQHGQRKQLFVFRTGTALVGSLAQSCVFAVLISSRFIVNLPRIACLLQFYACTQIHLHGNRLMWLL